VITSLPESSERPSEKRSLAAREFVNRYEGAILPNAKESVDLTSNRYRAGESNFPSLLLAQRTFLQTQVAYLDALRELRETSVLLNGMLAHDRLLDFVDADPRFALVFRGLYLCLLRSASMLVPRRQRAEWCADSRRRCWRG
jgi:hypothetical protein